MLQSTQNDLDIAKAELNSVESQRLEGISRIEASEKLVEELRSRVDSTKKRTEQEVLGMISSFKNFEKKYWEKEERWQQLHNVHVGAGLE